MVAAYTQLFAERYRGKLDEQAEKYIGYAVDGATRMQTLIQDLLRFSRAGRLQADLKSTNSGWVVDQAIRQLTAAIHESGAVILRGELPQILADESHLIQVFQNLIANAIKFRGSQPPKVEITAQQDCDNWRFTVSDNGIGIAPQDLENIFVIFRRLHTRQEYPGNGIGLSICKKVIERHGGHIWAESTLGQGSKFKFTVPMLERAEQFFCTKSEATYAHAS